LEEFVGATAKFAESVGDFFVARQAEEIDRRVTKNGQILRTMPGFHLAFILAERHITHPMQAIFDAPVATPMSQQNRRVSLPRGKAGDGVLDFDRRFALAPGCAFETANLAQAGPIEMPGQSRAGLQMSLDNASMSFGNVACFRERRLTLFFRSGGKIPAQNPFRQRP
jgi:hypothetical protein